MILRISVRRIVGKMTNKKDSNVKNIENSKIDESNFEYAKYFRVRSRELGGIKDGFNCDKISELLEKLEELEELETGKRKL